MTTEQYCPECDIIGPVACSHHGLVELIPCPNHIPTGTVNGQISLHEPCKGTGFIEAEVNENDYCV